MNAHTQIAMRPAADILREYYQIEARIASGEKGQVALKKYARTLSREYRRAVSA